MFNNETVSWMEKGKVEEIQFLRECKKKYPVRCVEETFYTRDGEEVPDSLMRTLIIGELYPHVKTDLYRLGSQLTKLAKAVWREEEPDFGDSTVPFTNGLWDVCLRSFYEDTRSIRAINAPYDPQAPDPQRFLRFLHDLVEEEDIPTIQQYLGYCLIPTNKAQKMLILMGKGGEGKSVLGRVIHGLFGNRSVNNSIMKLSNSAFARADLQGKLVMVDDDMSMAALKDTHTLKTIVTLDGNMDLEKKGKQSYQAPLYCRIIGFTNGSLSALYDRTNGFYRRQLVIRCKDRRDRKTPNDPDLAKEIILHELPGIARWAVDGLLQLHENRYRFHVSDRSKAILKSLMLDNDILNAFLRSKGYVILDPQGAAATSGLYQMYQLFCKDNGFECKSLIQFSRQLAERADEFDLHYTRSVPSQTRKDVRGWKGIKLAFPPQWGAAA